MTGQACVDVRPTMRAFAGAEVAEQALALPTLGLHISTWPFSSQTTGTTANAASVQSGLLQTPVGLSCRTYPLWGSRETPGIQDDHREPKPGLCSGNTGQHPDQWCLFIKGMQTDYVRDNSGVQDHTITLGRDPVVPSVTGVPVVDTLFWFGRI